MNADYIALMVSLFSDDDSIDKAIIKFKKFTN